MFNNYSCSQNTKINAVTGGILKNHPKSWFKRFHLKSSYAENLFVPNGDTVVLQMMICGDMEVIAELIYRKNFEEGLVAKND